MAAGPGLGLLHKLLRDKKSILTLADHNITADDFVEEERSVYDMIIRHFELFGVMPEIRTVEVETSVPLRGFPDEVDGYWIDRVQRRNRRSLILAGVEEVQTLAKKDELDEAHKKLQDVLIRLDVGSPVDKVVAFADVCKEVVAGHDVRRMAVEMAGIPFGLEYLDRISDGAQAEDTVAIVGRPGVGKSYLILSFALKAWLRGYVPLIVSLEMSPIQVVRRTLALKAGVPVTLIRLGQLSTFARGRLAQNIAEIAGMSSDTPFYIMHGSLHSTVEDIVLRIQELKPNALYVDGAYMLRTRAKTNQRWERVAETAEVLKQIAVEFGIPVLASYQFNRRGPGSLGNIAASDVIGQLASIVMGIDNEDAKTAYGTFTARLYKLLELIKGREGERGLLRILYDLDRMVIEQHEVVKGYRTHG